jgi:hypothetical protein
LNRRANRGKRTVTAHHDGTHLPSFSFFFLLSIFFFLGLLLSLVCCHFEAQPLPHRQQLHHSAKIAPLGPNKSDGKMRPAKRIVAAIILEREQSKPKRSPTQITAVRCMGGHWSIAAEDKLVNTISIHARALRSENLQVVRTKAKTTQLPVTHVPVLQLRAHSSEHLQ